MKPYSLDFRQKILEIREKEKLSVRQLAKHFHVATSFIQKIVKQYQETGDLNPLPQGGHPKPKIGKEELVTLVEIIEKNNDATLHELCDLLDKETGVRVSISTMGRVTQKLNYSLKKKHYTQQRKPVKEFNVNG
jgi:transposase